MHYVVWGIGRRGKRVTDFLGIEQIVAFIDEDKRHRHINFLGKEVISFEEFKTRYNNALLVVTPLNNSDIISRLETEKIIYVLPEDIMY